jgi:uncharacterized protein YbjT (DUF2867 family)
LLGATGLVGRQVLRQALADLRVARVIAPTRRPLAGDPLLADPRLADPRVADPRLADPRLSNPVLDFEHLSAQSPWWTVHAVVCALGTTMARAGSREAFRRIDVELPLQIARWCRAGGARAFALNSALGADPASRVFYSRVKGELEQALRALDFPSLTLVRPGLLGGDRDERRPAERAGILVSQALAPLLPRRYRVVPAERVAHHLLRAALTGAPGVTVLPSESLT